MLCWNSCRRFDSGFKQYWVKLSFPRDTKKGYEEHSENYTVCDFSSNDTWSEHFPCGIGGLIAAIVEFRTTNQDLITTVHVNFPFNKRSKSQESKLRCFHHIKVVILRQKRNYEISVVFKAYINKKARKKSIKTISHPNTLLLWTEFLKISFHRVSHWTTGHIVTDRLPYKKFY